jgi:hypothetical protein
VLAGTASATPRPPMAPSRCCASSRSPATAPSRPAPRP